MSVAQRHRALSCDGRGLLGSSPAWAVPLRGTKKLQLARAPGASLRGGLFDLVVLSYRPAVQTEALASSPNCRWSVPDLAGPAAPKIVSRAGAARLSYSAKRLTQSVRFIFAYPETQCTTVILNTSPRGRRGRTGHQEESARVSPQVAAVPSRPEPSPRELSQNAVFDSTTAASTTTAARKRYAMTHLQRHMRAACPAAAAAAAADEELGRRPRTASSISGRAMLP